MRSFFQSSPRSQRSSAGYTDASLPSGPWMVSRTSAQSSTERAMGPSLSMVQLRAMAPVRGTRPKVGRSPVSPQRVEGEEMEPSVSEPIGAHGQRAQRELGHQHGSGSIQALDNGGVFIKRLVLEAARAPGRGVAFHSKQIFCAPGNAVERTTIFSGGNLGIGSLGLGQGSFLSKRDHEVQSGVVALQAGEVHL